MIQMSDYLQMGKWLDGKVIAASQMPDYLQSVSYSKPQN